MSYAAPQIWPPASMHRVHRVKVGSAGQASLERPNFHPQCVRQASGSEGGPVLITWIFFRFRLPIVWHSTSAAGGGAMIGAGRGLGGEGVVEEEEADDEDDDLAVVGPLLATFSLSISATSATRLSRRPVVAAGSQSRNHPRTFVSKSAASGPGRAAVAAAALRSRKAVPKGADWARAASTLTEAPLM